MDQIPALIGDGLLGGPDDVVPAGAPGQSHQSAPGVHIPVGGPKAGEGGDQIDAAGVRHLGGVILRVPGLTDEAQLVPDPLDHRAPHKDGALQGVLHLPVQADCNGGQQAVVAAVEPLAGVHQQETAGAVGVFGLAGREAGLAEQSGLLVAGDAGDGDLRTLEFYRAVDPAGVPHLGQHGHGDAQAAADMGVPAQ